MGIRPITEEKRVFLEELFEEIDSCLDCGKPHEYRPVAWNSENQPTKFTWADPDDEHAYRRDVKGTLDKLRMEVQSGAQAASGDSPSGAP